MNYKKYLHVPTGKVYQVNGAGGLLPVDGSTNSALPLWLIKASNDWIEQDIVQIKPKKYTQEWKKNMLDFAEFVYGFDLDEHKVKHLTGNETDMLYTHKNPLSEYNKLYTVEQLLYIWMSENLKLK